MRGARCAVAGALLLLDNCERLLDEAVSLVSRLLDQAPGIRVCDQSGAARLDEARLDQMELLPLKDAS